MKNKLSASWYVKVLIIFGLIIASYFVTRLINLTIIPIFTDEAIYLRWAQLALGDPRWRFISLIDGKQPLFIWLLLPALKFISDPLVAGRLVSVGAGFAALVGMVTFGWYLKSFKGAVVAAVLYLVGPFFLVYDRLAIYEALVSALAIWTLFLSYLFSKKQRLDLALLLGTVIGAGLLTKSSALYYLLLLPATLLLLPWKKGEKRKQFFKWIGLSLVVIIQAQIYENILRLSEFRHYVGQKNLQFLFSTSELLADPFIKLAGNVEGLTTWLVGYLTIPFVVIVLVSVIWNFRRDKRETLFFLSYFAVPFFSLALFGKVIYPRFLLFMIFPLLILVVYFSVFIFTKTKNNFLLLGATLLLLWPQLYFDYKLLTDPVHAPLPTADRQQFINDWPAGYGIKEVVDFLRVESSKGKIVVGTEGTFGLFPMALELYHKDNTNITFKPQWPLNEFPDELSQDALSYPTYLVFKERNEIPKEWPLTLVAEYQRGDGPTYLRLFRVTSSNE